MVFYAIGNLMKFPPPRYKATLTKVVDGDTVDLSVDVGFHIEVNTRFRLADIDAPEIRGPEKVEGKKVKEWLIGRLSQGKIQVESEKAGKYGRWLGTIFVDGQNINQEMIELGLVERSTVK